MIEKNETSEQLSLLNDTTPKKEETELQVHEPSKLEVMLKKSGISEDSIIVFRNKFEDYENIAHEWGKKVEMLKVTSITQITEMKMASNARKMLKQKRIDIEKTRKELKADIIAQGKAIDDIAKWLTELIEPIEVQLTQIEKFKETEEARILQETYDARVKALEPYNVDITYVNVKHMPEAQWQEFLQKSIDAFEQEKVRKAQEELLRIETEKRLEQERIAEEQRLAELQKQQEEQARLEKEAAAKKQRELEAQLKAQKEAEEEKERRMKELSSIGLKFNGDEFCYKDINFHWTDIVCMSNAEFNKELDGAKIRMQALLNEEEQERKEQEIKIALQQKRYLEIQPYNKYECNVDKTKLWMLSEPEYKSIITRFKSLLEAEQKEKKEKEALFQKRAALLTAIGVGATDKDALVNKTDAEFDVGYKLLKDEFDNKERLRLEQAEKARKFEEQEKIRLAEEKRLKELAAASDHDKLKAFAVKIATLEKPEVESEESEKILIAADELLTKVSNYILKKIQKPE